MEKKLLKPVFIIAIVAVAMIGVMVPSVFADSMFDNVKWGSNIYENPYYKFAISYPDNWTADENAVLANVGGGGSSIVQFTTNSYSDYPANFIINKMTLTPQDFTELYNSNNAEIYELTTYILNDQFHNITIDDIDIVRFSDGIKLTMLFAHSIELSDLTFSSSDVGEYVIIKRHTVQHWLDTGEIYHVNFGALSDEYNSEHTHFKKAVESFVVGDNLQPPKVMYSDPSCGPGTEPINGICQIIQTEEKSSKGGGCLIATATYGSEMSQQVQQLRELRDNQLLRTESGTAFMSTFNDVYYSFSPIIADYERENPLFKEAVKLAITPMISTLSLMENAETESEVLSIGISVIVLNLGMYFAVPAIVIIGIKKKF